MRTFYLRHEVVVITAVSAVVYIALAVNVHLLLNWIIGPLWPVAWVWVAPSVVRRVTGWDDPVPGGHVAP